MNAKDFGQLLKEHPEILEDRKRFKAILRDIYPSERGNVNLMEIAHSAGTVDLLQGNVPKSFQVPRIMNLLIDEYSIAEEKARWAARLWVEAYEIFLKPEAEEKDAFRDCPNLTAHAPAGSKAKHYAKAEDIPFKSVQTAPVVQQQESFREPKPLGPKETNPSGFEIKKNDMGCSITKYTGPATDQIVIPEGVTEIGESVFSGCISLTSITIPNSVTKIGRNAFTRCSRLTNITIPEGVAEIGDWVFSGCSSLTSIMIPEGITKIGKGAFSDCSNLTSIIIPDSITKIEDLAFCGCSSLISITIPDSVIKIGLRTFFNCSNLMIHAPAGSEAERCAKAENISFKAIRIAPTIQQHDSFQKPQPAGRRKTNSGWFGIAKNDTGCSIIKYIGPAIDQIVIPAQIAGLPVTCICGWSEFSNRRPIKRHGCFEKCSGLTSIMIPDSVTEIGANTFWGCSSLISITIPEGVTKIGTRAFSHCSNLTSMIIPKGIAEIGRLAFWDCRSLTSIIIPEGVTEIGEEAFDKCPNLTIHAPAGSEMERYAKVNRIPFKPT